MDIHLKRNEPYPQLSSRRGSKPNQRKRWSRRERTQPQPETSLQRCTKNSSPLKAKKIFMRRGLAQGGPYSSWLVRVNAAGLGDLRQMGMDYMRSKGQETEYTLYVKKEKGLN